MTMAQWENERVYARFRTCNIPPVDIPMGANMCVMLWCAVALTLSLIFPVLCGLCEAVVDDDDDDDTYCCGCCCCCCSIFLSVFHSVQNFLQSAKKYCFVLRSAQDHFSHCIPEWLVCRWLERRHAISCECLCQRSCLFPLSSCASRLRNVAYCSFWGISRFRFLSFIHSLFFCVCVFRLASFRSRSENRGLSVCRIGSHWSGRHLLPLSLLQAWCWTRNSLLTRTFGVPQD